MLSAVVKTVAVGHCAVGEVHQHGGCRGEHCGRKERERRDEAEGHPRDGSLFAGTAPFSPHEPTVYAGTEVIDVDGHVGIESRTVIDEDVDGRHDDAGEPEPDAGPVFEPQVCESYGRTDCLQIVHAGYGVVRSTKIIIFRGPSQPRRLFVRTGCLPVRIRAGCRFEMCFRISSNILYLCQTADRCAAQD